MVEGTYPRDSISLEEWGKSQAKGNRGGANRVAQLFRDPDLQQEYFGFSATSCSQLVKPMALGGQAPGLQVSERRTGGAWLARVRPTTAKFPRALQESSRPQAGLGLLPLEGEEPPAVPPGAQTERAEGGRVEAKTRK